MSAGLLEPIQLLGDSQQRIIGLPVDDVRI